MKKALVTVDILMIIATIVPAALLLWECFKSAIFGTIPSGFHYGFDYGQLVYGAEAFWFTMMFYCYFLFFLVFAWVVLFLVTVIYTGLLVSFSKSKPATK